MWRRVVFWSLLPLVVPQALQVRRRAPRFAPARGPTSGRAGDGKPLRLLAIGDSIIAGVGVPTTDQALACRTAANVARETKRQVFWQARGISGATAAAVRQCEIPKLEARPFDVIVVSVGVNDVTSLASTRRWRENLSSLLDDLQAHSPDARIVVAGLPPLRGFPLLPQPLRALLGLRAQSFDAVARSVVAQREQIEHVPLDFEPTPEKFSPDGYHPSSESYGVFSGMMGASAVRLLAIGRQRNWG